MDDIEIFLNRLFPDKKVYESLSKALGDADISSSEELGAFIEQHHGLSLKVYVSNEEIKNKAVDEITEVLEKYAAENKLSLAIIVDEFLNLIDSEAHLTSQAKPRSLVHRDGDLHPAVHIWIIKRKDMGIYVLLQKRSHEKDINPDCFDVSAAGHVSQGEEFRSSAVRETAEELGLKIHGSKLELIGLHKFYNDDGDIHDHELRAVYLCREPLDTDHLKLQKSEVSEVCWAEVDEMLASMGTSDFQHCIDLTELQMIKKAVF